MSEYIQLDYSTPQKAIETLANYFTYIEKMSEKAGDGFDGMAIDGRDFSLYQVLKTLHTLQRDYVLVRKDTGLVVDPTGRSPILPFSLGDAEDGTDKIVTGTVEVMSHGIGIAFDKFHTANDDTPVLIEQIGGIPQVVVWADLRKEDRTHRIGLKKAEVPFSVGDRVYWTDPDDGICSKWGKVVSVFGGIASLAGDDGSEVEASMHELSTKGPK